MNNAIKVSFLLGRRQQGVALLYVLLIFSVITFIASQIAMSLLLHTEKNTRYSERIQAKHYAMGAEQYIALLLEKDFQEDKKQKRKVDHEKEQWNVKRIGYELTDGEVELRVVDEQSKFNINWLMTNEASSEQYLNMFQNLLSINGLPVDLAQRLRIWFGVSLEALNESADSEYLMLDKPRRAGITLMYSPSELQLVKDIQEDDYLCLAPCLSALPVKSKININTATTGVIRSISNKITENDALALISGRGEEGFEKIEDIGRIYEWSDKINELKRAPISFFSSYFSAYIKATYRSTTFYLKTRFVRNDDGKVQVAGREIGPTFEWMSVSKEF